MARIVCLLLFPLLLAPALPIGARESGWVPISREPWQPPLASGAGSYRKSAKNRTQPGAEVKAGSTVYDRQPLVTEAELDNFLPLLPQFRAWARKNQEIAHPVVNKTGQPDFLYSPKAAEWVRAHGFEPARFFCIMGRMAAGLAIIEEGNDLPASRPRDMPAVDQEEIALARRHLGELLTAATPPAN